MTRTKQCVRKNKNKKFGHSDSTKFDKNGKHEEPVGMENGPSEIVPEGEPQIKGHGKTNDRLTHLLQVTFMACETLASVVRTFKENLVPVEIAQEALLFLLKTYFFKDSKFEGVQASIHGTATINFSVPPYVINNYTFSDSLQETIEEAIITLDSYEFESHHKKYDFCKDISVITNLLDNGFNYNSSVSFAFQQRDSGRKPVAGMIYFPFKESKEFVMAAFSERSLKASFPLHSPSRSAPPKDSARGKVLISRDSYGTTIRAIWRGAVTLSKILITIPIAVILRRFKPLWQKDLCCYCKEEGVFWWIVGQLFHFSVIFFLLNYLHDCFIISFLCIIEIAPLQAIIHAYQGRMMELSYVLTGQIAGKWNFFNFHRVFKPDQENTSSSSSTTGTVNGLFILANAQEKIDFIQLQELDASKATVESFTTTEKRKF
jgi:hypothetical protein